MIKLVFASFLLLAATIGTAAQQIESPKLTGPYLGQKPPGTTPEVFAPGIVSKEGDQGRRYLLGIGQGPRGHEAEEQGEVGPDIAFLVPGEIGFRRLSSADGHFYARSVRFRTIGSPNRGRFIGVDTVNKIEEIKRRSHET